jgi:TolA-binding protein
MTRAVAALVLVLTPVVWGAAAESPIGDRERDAAADRKRDEMIEDLRAIIPRTPEGDRRADLHFQLAELWWEKARYAASEEIREHDDASTKWLEMRLGEEPRLDQQRSEGYRKEAIRLYREILDRYPSYARRDEVLFVAGHNLYESGDKEQAVALYGVLIRQYPQSRFVPDAYVQIGEHFFAGNDLRRAREAFAKAASFRLPKVYPFALYKLAWCDYNAGAYQAAIAKFQEVIAYSEGEMRADRVQLRQEALKDIVLAYARVDVIDPAVAYLAEKGAEHGIDAIDRLAATYFDDGKFDQSIRVYRILEERAPHHPRAPSWQQKIVLACDKLNRRELVLAEMKRMVSEYGPQSGWAKANTAQKAAVAEANDLAEGALRDLVQDYHQEAIKTKSAATYRLARDIYRQYLEAFPHSESAASMRFYSAEILYALEEWDAAADEYARVVEEAPGGPQAQRAAYNAILALEKSVDTAKGKLKKRELGDAAKIEEGRDKGQIDRSRKLQIEAFARDVEEQWIPANEEKLIAACDRYLRLAPGAKDEIVIRYKAAFVFYERHHYLEAAKRFGEIILRWPTDAWSQKAAHLSLDILNTKEQWQALSGLAQRFLENPDLCPAGSKFGGEVARIAEGAQFKYLMQLYEQKKDYALAAKEFRAFVALYPKSEHAPKALYNALLIADKADELDVEIAAGEQLLREYPSADAAIVQRTMPALASACERAGRYADAIRWYEEAQRRWPSDARAPDWLYNAAVWREGLGDDAGALADWQRYLRQYRARPDAAKIAFNIGIVFERLHDLRHAASHWSAFQRDWAGTASPGQLLLARYRQAVDLREIKAPQAGVLLLEVGQRLARLPEGQKTAAVIDAAAHARFLLVEPSFDEFISIHFRHARQADLVRALKLKRSRMERLVSAYGEVIAIGSPRWSEAAFERIGEAYRNFNKGLLDAPLPRGLDADQRELYRSTLESQALPLEDKATAAFADAIRVSQKSGVYSDWVIKAQDLLREYQPDPYGEVHRPPFVENGVSRGVAPELPGGGP